MKEAIDLSNVMIGLFEDKVRGRFFLTSADSETILTNRAKEYYDGAIPSGNSMAALTLLKLYYIALKKDFDKAYSNSLNYISRQLIKSPTAFTQLLLTIDVALSPTKEIVIVSKDYKEPFIDKATSLIYSHFLSNKVILLRTIKKGDDIISIAPWIKECNSLAEGKTTIYICENRVCNLPLTDLDKLEKILQKNKILHKNIS